MAVTQLTFTENEGKFVSESVQVTSNAIGLQVVVKDPTVNNVVEIYQSSTGDKFAKCGEFNQRVDVADTSVHGLVPGMYVQIQCNTEPVEGFILNQD